MRQPDRLEQGLAFTVAALSMLRDAIERAAKGEWLMATLLLLITPVWIWHLVAVCNPPKTP